MAGEGSGRGRAGVPAGIRNQDSTVFGRVTLVGGAAVVPYTPVTANTNFQLTSQVDGGTPGFLRVSVRVAGTSFTITSSNAADTSTVAWWAIEP